MPDYVPTVDPSTGAFLDPTVEQHVRDLVAQTGVTQTALTQTALTAALAGKADLSGGKLATGQVPDLAIVDYLGTAGGQTGMLAKTGQRGDWVVRNDTSTVWVITGSDPTQLSSWTQLAYPTGGGVTSVNGKTGPAVTLVATDVGAQAPVGEWLPEDYGWLAWACDPIVAQGNSSTGSSGQATTIRLKCRKAGTISKAILSIATAGAGLTNVGVGIADSAGNVLTSSVNTNGATATAFQGTGAVTITFASPVAVTAGQEVILFFWVTGTTVPAFSRASNQAAVNAGLTNLRAGRTSTGYTTAAPTSLGTVTDPGIAVWGAVG